LLDRRPAATVPAFAPPLAPAAFVSQDSCPRACLLPFAAQHGAVFKASRSVCTSLSRARCSTAVLVTPQQLPARCPAQLFRVRECPLSLFRWGDRYTPAAHFQLAFQHAVDEQISFPVTSPFILCPG